MSDNKNPTGAKKKQPTTSVRRMHPRASGSRSHSILPPIRGSDVAGTSSGSTPALRTNSGENKRSKYHAGCMKKHSQFLDWFSLKEKKINPVAIQSRNSKSRSYISLKDADEQEMIARYLANNKDFLDNYVSEKIPQEVIEKWLYKKLNGNNPSPINNSQPSKPRIKEAPCTKFLFMNIIKILRIDPSEHIVIWELAKCAAISIGVDAYRVYKLYPEHSRCAQYFLIDYKKSPYEQSVPHTLICLEPEELDHILNVAKTGNCKVISRCENPTGFPEMPEYLLLAFRIKNTKAASHVMYQPILSKCGKTSYIIEMWRTRDSFRELDQEISSNFLVWGSLALQYCDLYLDKKKDRDMSDFLLSVVKAVFEEMVSLDQLIKRILEFAQRLVNADRASLFLVDFRSSELVSTVFDLKFEEHFNSDMEKKEIRMPMHRGIAGHVAMTGDKMNIPDAYADSRFNSQVDGATGYKTATILCMPVKVEGRVIGVVQMVNKRNTRAFTQDDETAFEIFSTFFGLALHHARLYDRIIMKEQKYRVALEVLSYHNTCKENEVQSLLSNNEPIRINLDDFYIDPYNLNDTAKCKTVIMMFNDLFGLSNFDMTTLTRFFLTVKKNYRNVPYHNFDHGWTVAHSMYVILKKDSHKKFNEKMRLALFVASLCHDLDHRGYTNKYMSETASPLASMYTTSTLEHHHFNITVTILQQEGHNIFSHVTSEEYKEILGYIKHCILATDLAAFFPNFEKIKNLCVEERVEFNWDLPCHSELAMAISMTAADLSASAKPWEIQIKTVKVIFEEFYDQGDKERAAGRTPIPMMDRNKPEEQPSSQVGFLSQICIPCYNVLHNILPNTKPMYAMALKNLERWRSRAAQVNRELEHMRPADNEPNDCNATTNAIPNDSNGIDNQNVVPVGVPKINVTNKGEEIYAHESNAAESRKALKTFMTNARNNVIPWDEEEEFIEPTAEYQNHIWRDLDRLARVEEEAEFVDK